jgi:hypothetical protein
MYENQLEWINSPYMNRYKATKSKSTYDTGSQDSGSDNDESTD